MSVNPVPTSFPRCAASAKAGASVAAVSIQEREGERVPFESSPPAEKGEVSYYYRHPPSKGEEEVAYHRVQ